MTNIKKRSQYQGTDTLAIENEATPSFISKTENRKIGLAKWFVKGTKHNSTQELFKAHTQNQQRTATLPKT